MWAFYLGVGRKPGDGRFTGDGRRLLCFEAEASRLRTYALRRGRLPPTPYVGAPLSFCLLAGAWGFRLRLSLRRDRSRLATLDCFRLRQGYAEIKRPHRSPAPRAYPCLPSSVLRTQNFAVVPTANYRKLGIWRTRLSHQ